jgi:hypothetical protein
LRIGTDGETLDGTKGPEGFLDQTSGGLHFLVFFPVAATCRLVEQVSLEYVAREEEVN